MRFVKIGTSLMVATLVMFVVAIIGFSASAPAVGITFLILAIACAAGGFSVGVVFRSRARKWRDQQLLAAQAASMQGPPGYGQGS